MGGKRQAICVSVHSILKTDAFLETEIFTCSSSGLLPASLSHAAAPNSSPKVEATRVPLPAMHVTRADGSGLPAGKRSLM